ncbi:MAG TPA: hypothetical protein VKT28_17850 [Puia sp.]|nr:hypothetical protein [Puia sp.]
MITKTIRNILALPAFALLLFACKDESKEKTPDITKDSAATAQSGQGTGSTTKDDSASTNSSAKKSEPADANDNTKPATEAVKGAIDKVKSKTSDAVEATKKTVHKADSAIAAKKDETVPAKKDATAANTDEKLLPASSADNSKAFAPKYGLVPRDATENNITSLKNAFPDKQTLFKVNFDAEPDAEMQEVKTRIITALKKSGYTNISEKSITFHPTRMPKDIHYELQRDGSVVIWLQPANAQ